MKIIDVKETLANALIEAAKYKPVEKITVSDIVEKCNTSRRTFYNHFQDKYDLIMWIYSSRIDRILSGFRHPDSWSKCITDIYQVFLDNKAYFSVVIKHKGQNSFFQNFYSHSYNHMKEVILSESGKDQLPEDMDYALTAHVHGQVNCVAKWIQEGMTIPPEVMASYNIENMPSLIKKFFAD